MARRAWLLAGALILLAPGWFYPFTAAALIFFKETVSEEAVPNAELKIDSQGNIHVVYLTKDTEEIKYGRRLQNQWIIESLGIKAQWVSLALDPLDKAHLAFYQPDISQVKYAKKIQTPGGWEITPVHEGRVDNSQCRIAAKGLEQVYIAFNSSSDAGGLNGIYLAVIDNLSGAKSLETVEAGAYVGFSPYLVLDALGRPHLTYYDRGLEKLKYAFKDNGGWQITPVDNAVSSGWQSALALDAFGWPHIAYYDWMKADLKYTYRNSSGWHRSTVDSAGTVGQYPALGMDPRGRLLFAYYDDTLGDLKIAYKGGYGWKRAAVDQDGDVGYNLSLGVNDLGEACLLYYEVEPLTGGTKLKFAVVTFPRVYLAVPAGGEEWASGSPQAVSWRAADSPEISSYKLQYSLGSTWSTIVDNLPAAQKNYLWQVPLQQSDKKCRLRILGKSTEGKVLGSDQSPYFTLTP